MIEPWRQLRAQFEMLGTQFFRDLLQSLKMRRWITIPKRMVGDEIEAPLKKGAQWLKRWHAYKFLRRK